MNVARLPQVAKILSMLVVVAAVWRISETNTIYKLQKDVLQSAPCTIAIRVCPPIISGS